MVYRSEEMRNCSLVYQSNYSISCLYVESDQALHGRYSSPELLLCHWCSRICNEDGVTFVIQSNYVTRSHDIVISVPHHVSVSGSEQPMTNDGVQPPPHPPLKDG